MALRMVVGSQARSWPATFQALRPTRRRRSASMRGRAPQALATVVALVQGQGLATQALGMATPALAQATPDTPPAPAQAPAMTPPPPAVTLDQATLVPEPTSQAQPPLHPQDWLARPPATDPVLLTQAPHPPPPPLPAPPLPMAPRLACLAPPPPPPLVMLQTAPQERAQALATSTMDMVVASSTSWAWGAATPRPMTPPLVCCPTFPAHVALALSWVWPCELCWRLSGSSINCRSVMFLATSSLHRTCLQVVWKCLLALALSIRERLQAQSL